LSGKSSKKLTSVDLSKRAGFFQITRSPFQDSLKNSIYFFDFQQENTPPIIFNMEEDNKSEKSINLFQEHEVDDDLPSVSDRYDPEPLG
jgi:hypothetical protein